MDWKKYLDYKDIRFWLTILFLVRLYGITLPPLEFQHPWRQTDGLMIARNFYETLPNIFYPMVDTAGEKSGITGSEFPIFNYLIYLVSLVFGFQDWYGRLIVLIVSTFGSYYFYKSIRKFFGDLVAFNATIILTCSYWFSYSRKIFPDCFSASLCLMALFFVLEYLENGKWRDLLLYIILGALGGLSKISSTLLLSVLALPILSKAYTMDRKYWTIAASCVVLAFIAGWYFAWVPHLNETYGYGDHFSMGYSLSLGWDQIRSHMPEILKRLYIVPVKYLGVAIFVVSLGYVVYKKKWIILSLFTIPYLCFLLVILKTGTSIIADQYYILCIIPVMAFVSGYALGQLPNKIVMLLIVAATAVENIGDQIGDAKIHEMNAFFENLESIVDGVSNRNDLFLVNTGPHCPTAMYFAHRKGWTVGSQQIDQALLDDVKGKGCKFVLVCKQMYREDFDVKLDLPQLYESEYFRIYALK